MTPIILLEELKNYIQDITKDIMLPVRVSRGSNEPKERPAKVHLMNLPKKEDEIQQVPYILIKYLTGKDEQPEGQLTDSGCMVRIIVATYAEDAGEGGMALLNVMSRIRYNLLKERLIAGQFQLKNPLEAIVYQEDTRPYYLGELMTSWRLPSIEREVII